MPPKRRQADRIEYPNLPALPDDERLRLVPWIQSHCFIQPKAGGLELFRLRKFQKKLAAIVVNLQILKKPIRIIVLKSRQLGFSTLVESFLFALVHNRSNKNAVIIAHTADSSDKLFRMSHRYYENLDPSKTRELVGERPTKKCLQYVPPHGSRFDVLTAGGGEVGRGGTVQYNHFSEVAFWPQDEKVWSAVEPSVPKPTETHDSMIIVESTANGPQGIFYNLWQQAIKIQTTKDIRKIFTDYDTNDGWIGIFESWRDDPASVLPLNPDEEFTLDPKERDFNLRWGPFTREQMKWARTIRNNSCLGSWERFHQEYPVSPDLAFLYSGYPVFDQEVIDKQLKESYSIKPVFFGEIHFDTEVINCVPVLIETLNGYLYIYEQPNPENSYVLASDVSEGIGADFSEAMVLSTHPDGSVHLAAHIFSNMMNPMFFATRVYLLGAYYYWCPVSVERNSVGMATLETLNSGHPDYHQMAQYPSLYMHTTVDRQTQEVVQRFGFQTSDSSKSTAIACLQESIHSGKLRIPSTRILRQLQGFSKDPAKKGPKRWIQGFKDPESQLYADDAVMTLAMAEKVRRDVADSDMGEFKSAWASW